MERIMKKKKKKKQKIDDQEVVPEDILVFHILPRLPVKSLFRFKCVCKKWRRWISRDPNFMREQSRFSMASSSSSGGGVIYTGSHGDLRFIPTGGTPFHVPDPSLKFLKVSEPHILVSCNGLLCVESVRKSIYVCNPVTKERSRIPDTKEKELFGLAFEPLDSFPAYRLVCLHSITSKPGKEDREFRFTVFSSDTGLWITSTKKVVVNDKPDYPCCPTFAGGVLYWNFRTRFIWFDPRRDLAGVLMSPDSPLPKRSICFSIGVWEDKLTYTRILDDEMIETWIVRDFKWTRIFQAILDTTVQIRDDDSYFPQGWRKNSFVLPYQGGDNLYAVHVDKKSLGVSCFKMKRGELTKLYARRNWQSNPACFPYINSFVPLPKLSKPVS